IRTKARSLLVSEHAANRPCRLRRQEKVEIQCRRTGRWPVGLVTRCYSSFAYSAEAAHFIVEGPGGAGGLESAGQREGNPTWGRRQSRASSPRARRGSFAAIRKLTPDL